MVMSFCSSLSDRFESPMSAVDTANIDDNKLSFDFVQSRCFKEEQNHAWLDQDAPKSLKRQLHLNPVS